MAQVGASGLIFTAGIGENAAQIRELACDNLKSLGYQLDPEKNNRAAGIIEAEISTAARAAKIYVIPTNEELPIAPRHLPHHGENRARVA